MYKDERNQPVSESKNKHAIFLIFAFIKFPEFEKRRDHIRYPASH
jgi:hypothetical protein